MGKHNKKKKLKNAFNTNFEEKMGAQKLGLDVGDRKIDKNKNKSELKNANDKYGAEKVVLSLWDYLNHPKFKKTSANFDMPDIHVKSDISLSEIPSAKELLSRGNLTRRQNSFFFLSNKQISHLLYSPKVLVREEYITASKELANVHGFNSFHNYCEQIYLVPSLTNPNKTEVLVLAQKYETVNAKNQPCEVTLSLYRDGKVEDCVSIFRFESGKNITHSSKRYVGNTQYCLNKVEGPHLHVISEEEELYHEVSLNLDQTKIEKQFDKTRVFGKWFASKMIKPNGQPIETLNDFMHVCRNDFGFGTKLVTMDNTLPIKNIELELYNHNAFNNCSDSFALVSDSKTLKFVQNARYLSPTIGTAEANASPEILYDNNSQYNSINQEQVVKMPQVLDLEGGML